MRPGSSTIAGTWSGAGEGLEQLESIIAKQASGFGLLEKAITTTLEAESVEQAVARLLDLIKRHLDVPLAHAYLAGHLGGGQPDSALVSREIWSCDDPRSFASLIVCTRDEPLLSTAGLGGEALRSGQPEFRRSYSPSKLGPRAVVAGQVGLSSYYGIPLLGDDRVVALLEFFAPDEALISDLDRDFVERSVACLGPLFARSGTDQASYDRDSVIRLAQKTAGLAYRVWEGGSEGASLSPELLNLLGVGQETGPVMRDSDFLARFVDPRDRARMAQANRDHFAAARHVEECYRLIRADGSVIWVRETIDVEFDHDGRFWRAVGVMQNITAFKTVEAELLNAKEAAEAANRAKSLFLANVSHELRTPLNAIIGFSEIMEDEVFGPVADDRYKRYVSDIRDSGVQLLKTINDVLDLSKIEAGRFDLHMEPVDIVVLCEQAVRLVKGQRAFRHRDIELAFPTPRVVLRADQRAFRQIMVNLLSNACKFSLPESLVWIRGHLGDDGAVTVDVIDQGIGMTAAEKDRAMEPFQQVDNSFGRQYEGTGLGLPLAKSMTEQQNAIFSVTSTPGEGTTVRLVWPADQVL